MRDAIVKAVEQLDRGRDAGRRDQHLGFAYWGWAV